MLYKPFIDSKELVGSYMQSSTKPTNFLYDQASSWRPKEVIRRVDLREERSDTWLISVHTLTTSRFVGPTKHETPDLLPGRDKARRLQFA